MRVTILLSPEGIEVVSPLSHPESAVEADLFCFGLDCVASGPANRRVIDGVPHRTVTLQYDRPDALGFYVERLVRRFRELGFEVGVDLVRQRAPEPCAPLLPVLERALAALPGLLNDESAWQSLYVDYEHPHVERLFRSFEDDFRLYLHDIHPCDGGQALFHAHPWGSAMHVFDEYEMGVGVGAGMVPPPVVMRLLLAPGTRYEMTHPDAWHFARPQRHHARTVMVTGRPWGRESPRPTRRLGPLSEDRKRDLLAVFRALAADSHCRLSDIA